MRKEKPSLLNLLYLCRNTSSFFDYPIPSRIPFPSPRTHARAHECASTTIPRTRAHNVGEKTTRKVARRNDRQILFPLLLPYSPTNSLPFPTNAQIKKAHLSAFLRNAESSGEQRVAFLGEKKEKKRKRNQRNPFFPPRSRTNPFKTPLQPSTALFPREFPSSFISKHERKKKKVGASRIEHATPTDSSLQRSLTSKSRRTIQTTLSLSLSPPFRSGFSLAVSADREHVRFLEDIPPYLYGPLISCLSPVVVDGGDGPAGTLAQVWRHESVTKSRAPVDGTTLCSLSLSLGPLHGYFLSEVWRVPWPGRGKRREREKERESAGHLGALKKPPGLGRAPRKN